MRRIKVPTTAFVQPKGLQVSNKDAVMEKVVNEQIVEKVTEVVNEKAIELVESKSEEIEKKVEETTDKVLDTVQENTQEVAEKIEDAIEKVSKPIADLIDKIDDNPAVKEVLENITDSIVEQVDGRVFSCSCFGFLWSLQITRNKKNTPPSKSKDAESKSSESPVQSVEVKEQPSSSTPSETQSVDPVKDTSVSV